MTATITLIQRRFLQRYFAVGARPAEKIERIK
jgi:hypothetical protein